jgi:hypothetical protein
VNIGGGAAIFSQAGGFHESISVDVSADGVYTLSEGVLSIETGTVQGELVVGRFSNGTFNQSGGLVTGRSLVIHIGNTPSAYNGTYAMSGGTASFEEVTIGSGSFGDEGAGIALLNQSGGTLYTRSMSFASGTPADCIYQLSGGTLYAGVVGLTNSGTATSTFTMTNSAVATIGQFIVGAVLNLHDSVTVNVTDELSNGSGEITLHGGVLRVAGRLTLNYNNGPYNGRIDLMGGKLIVQGASPEDKAGKVAQLLAAIDAGATPAHTWTGKGITSSAADSTHYTVGIFDNADLNFASLAGFAMDANTLIVALARVGDANFDGKVDAFDLNLLASHWQQDSGALTSDGDFNRDEKVDAFDLNLLAAQWQAGTGGSLEALLAAYGGFTGLSMPVPEPGGLACLGMGGVLLLRRRRRRGRATQAVVDVFKPSTPRSSRAHSQNQISMRREKDVVFQRVWLPPGKQSRSSRKESERSVEVTTRPKPLVQRVLQGLARFYSLYDKVHRPTCWHSPIAAARPTRAAQG